MNKWLRILLVIFCFAIVSVLLYFTFKAFGITNISTLRELITKSGKSAYFVYIIISTILIVCLCFIPLLDTSLIILSIALFGSKIAFILNVIVIFLATSILFFIGDKLGEKFVKKLIGEKTLIETQNKIHNKSKFWLPFFIILPGFPDEAICLIAGMTKIKYWYLTLISVLYHAFEICLICFLGSGFINWSVLTIIDWIVIANLFLIDVFLLCKLEKHLEKKLNKNQKNH